jgi:hypothetical protein
MTRSLLGVAAVVILSVLAVGYVTKPLMTSQSLQVFVQLDPYGLRVTNDTNRRWQRCVVELDGGYAHQIQTFAPQQTVAAVYREFSRAGQRLPKGEELARARWIEVSCLNGENRSQSASIRMWRDR